MMGITGGARQWLPVPQADAEGVIYRFQDGDTLQSVVFPVFELGYDYKMEAQIFAASGTAYLELMPKHLPVAPKEMFGTSLGGQYMRPAQLSAAPSGLTRGAIMRAEMHDPARLRQFCTIYGDAHILPSGNVTSPIMGTGTQTVGAYQAIHVQLAGAESSPGDWRSGIDFARIRLSTGNFTKPTGARTEKDHTTIWLWRRATEVTA